MNGLICPYCMQYNCIQFCGIYLAFTPPYFNRGILFLRYLCTSKNPNKISKFIILNEYLEMSFKNKKYIKSNNNETYKKCNIFLNKEYIVSSIKDFYDLYRSTLIQIENEILRAIEKLNQKDQALLFEKAKNYVDNNNILFNFCEMCIKTFTNNEENTKNINFIIKNLKKPYKLNITEMIRFLRYDYYSSLFHILPITQITKKRIKSENFNVQYLQGHSLPLTGLTSLKNGALCSGSLGTLNYWRKDNETGIFMEPLTNKPSKSLISSIIELEDNVIAYSVGKEIREMNILTNYVLGIYSSHDNQIESIVSLKEKTMLASGGIDKTIKLWDRKTFQCIFTTISPNHKFINALLNIQIQQDNLDFLISAEDEIVIYELKEKHLEIKQHLDEHKTIINDLCFLYDNNSFASASYDNNINIYKYNPMNNKYSLSNILRGHQDAVFSVILGLNGNLISGSRDKSIKIWDLTTQECLTTYLLHKGHVSFVIQLNDGRICSTSPDKDIIVYNDIIPSSRKTKRGNIYYGIYYLLHY